MKENKEDDIDISGQIIGLAITSFFAEILWNETLPVLFSGVHEIGYFQMIALWMLIKYLLYTFGSNTKS